ncbi:hypothetical protein [Bradyrhizobium sp. SZCCHNRI2049]|uniref:hypothetical protein n=1 Tax=Bradyrhizobium sp. SZCCHNRI2049 TaxID=3057287 RepID=UPI002916DE55|nr:hypothetical protein [Bradyrhizobium sp. SZCCHNRI2049]
MANSVPELAIAVVFWIPDSESRPDVFIVELVRKLRTFLINLPGRHGEMLHAMLRGSWRLLLRHAIWDWQEGARA